MNMIAEVSTLLGIVVVAFAGYNHLDDKHAHKETVITTVTEMKKDMVLAAGQSSQMLIDTRIQMLDIAEKTMKMKDAPLTADEKDYLQEIRNERKMLKQLKMDNQLGAPSQ